MFKIRPYRRYLNADDNKILGLIIEYGYECADDCDCPHGYECKYRGRYKLHNLICEIKRWFYVHFNIDLKFPIFFQHHRAHLSGTTKCPHKMDRMYTCFQCEYARGLRGCSNEDYQNARTHAESHDPDTPNGRCKFFKIDPIYENYDKKTGEYL